MGFNVTYKDDLYVYSLPEDVRKSLEVMYFNLETLKVQDVNSSSSSTFPKSREEVRPFNKGYCSTCRIKLDDDEEEQRYHYKTDFHRFNLKRHLNRQEPITEDEFENLIEKSSIDSLSGSDSESEGDEEYNQQKSKLEKAFANLSTEESSSHDNESVSFLKNRSPFILFKSPLLEEGKAFGVYRALFTDIDLNYSPVEVLKSWSQEPICSSKSALFMIGGGHFAGAIISHVPKDTKGNFTTKENRREQSVNVLETKTFHRYTTRRKQGGAQSANDNAKGKANSAGSTIRRTNEQLLIQEVRQLLASWSHHLKECTSIFIRAGGTSMRKVFVDYDGAQMKGNDPRIKTFPFTTKRPTASELKRAWCQLTSLTIYELPKVSEDKKKPEKQKKPQDSTKGNTVGEVVVSEDEKHTQALLELLKKQRAPLLVSYVRKNNLSPNFILVPESKYSKTPTLLHYAGLHNLNHMIQVLIVNLKADPSTKNVINKTPYEIADASTKRAFQIVRHQLGEDYTDWSLAKVGPAKSKEDFLKQDQIEEEKLREQKQESIKEELNKKSEFEMKKPTFSSGGKLSDNVNRQQLDLNALTDIQKQRIMREQRARAAEARFSKLQGK